MELHSTKNKSVYNVPPELFPDKAEFISYGNEFWARGDKLSPQRQEELGVEGKGREDWVEVSQDDIPAGSSVHRIGAESIESTTEGEEGEEAELDPDQEMVKTGLGRTPGLVDATSQEFMDSHGHLEGEPIDEEKHPEEGEPPEENFESGPVRESVR